MLFMASNDIRVIHGMVIVADEGRSSATQMTTALLDLSPTAVTRAVIYVQILRLRRKLERDPSTSEIIQTERGVGYMFAGQVERY